MVDVRNGSQVQILISRVRGREGRVGTREGEEGTGEEGRVGERRRVR